MFITSPLPVFVPCARSVDICRNNALPSSRVCKHEEKKPLLQNIKVAVAIFISLHFWKVCIHNALLNYAADFLSEFLMS